MPIIRSKTDAEFFVMHNATAQDAGLSWEARGMLAYLLSKPEGWKTNMTDLVRRSSAGKDKCRRVMEELISAGYVVREERRVSGKIKGYDYFVYDRPSVGKPAQKDADIAGSPEPEKPEPEKPDAANPHHIKNREIERTERERTEEPLGVPTPQNSRQHGTDPRALETNPRATGKNPRALRPDKGSRLPDDWTLPDDLRAWTKTDRGWTDERISDTAERFRDYWISVAGAKGIKRDWPAVWRNWCRRDFGGSDRREDGGVAAAHARALHELETMPDNDPRRWV